MRFSETVTRLRTSSADVYGNAGHDWTSPSSVSFKAFVVERVATTIGGSVLQRELLMPPGSDVTANDRLVVRGVTYKAVPQLISSPSADKLLMVHLNPLEGGPS